MFSNLEEMDGDWESEREWEIENTKPCLEVANKLEEQSLTVVGIMKKFGT